jgi:hypothetical protein
MMQETTGEESESKAVVSSDPTRQQEIEDLKRRLEAQDRRIKFLESLLAERFEVIKKNYTDLQPYFNSMKDKIMQLFFEDYFQRLTYEEIIELFQKKHPRISVSNLPRRVKELCEEKRLISCYDQERKRTIFHLRLMPLDDKMNGESVKKSEEDNKNLGEEEGGS